MIFFVVGLHALRKRTARKKRSDNIQIIESCAFIKKMRLASIVECVLVVVVSLLPRDYSICAYFTKFIIEICKWGAETRARRQSSNRFGVFLYIGDARVWLLRGWEHIYDRIKYFRQLHIMCAIDAGREGYINRRKCVCLCEAAR